MFFRHLVILHALAFFPVPANAACPSLLSRLSHWVGYAPKADVSIAFGREVKLQEIETMIPRIQANHPELFAVFEKHGTEISPQRIKTQLAQLPNTTFWLKRAKAELLHLEGLAALNAIDHPAKIERLIALTARFRSNSPSANSEVVIQALKERAQNPDPDIAHGAVMQAGGVAFQLSSDPSRAQVFLLQKQANKAQEILELGLKHPDASVRAAARRGRLKFQSLPGAEVPIYSDTMRDEVTQPIRAFRAVQNKITPSDPLKYSSEPDVVNLSKLELIRLPTNVLKGFLDSPRDQTVAAIALTQNRTLPELVPYLTHENVEIRVAALEGMQRRYETNVDGIPFVELLRQTVERDPNSRVQITAISVLADHPSGQAILEKIAENRALPKKIREVARNEARISGNAPQRPPNEEILALISSSPPATKKGVIDLSKRPVWLIKEVLKSDNDRLKVQAIRSLKGRTDQESMELLFNLTAGAELRSAALFAVSERNHSLADHLFESALSSDQSPAVFADAIRATIDIVRNSQHRGINSFRVVPNSLAHRWETIHDLTDRTKMTPDEQRVDDHARLLEVAANTYSLPSLNRFAKVQTPITEKGETRSHFLAKKMITERNRFLEGLPLGYELAGDIADATTSGLKMYYLKPDDLNQERPNILAVAGTEKWLDWYGNLTWGSTKRDSAAYQWFLNRIVVDLTAGKKIQITGHSLGGAMAQYFAYDALSVIKKNLAQEPDAAVKLKTIVGNLELVTWNAFGVQQVISAEQRFDESIRCEVANRAVHYRAAFDMVSKLGVPIGPVSTLPFTGWWGVVSAHNAENLRNAAVALGGLQNTKPQNSWLQFKPVGTTASAALAPVGRKFSDNFFKRNIEQHFETLLLAQQMWRREQRLDSLANDNWLNTEIGELLKKAVAIDPAMAKDLGTKWEAAKAGTAF